MGHGSARAFGAAIVESKLDQNGFGRHEHLRLNGCDLMSPAGRRNRNLVVFKDSEVLVRVNVFVGLCGYRRTNGRSESCEDGGLEGFRRMDLSSPPRAPF